jgi:hypothetical protein
MDRTEVRGSYVVRGMKSRSVRWTRSVARMEEMKTI